LDREIDKAAEDYVGDYGLAAIVFCLMAILEWVGYLTQAPRRPVLLTIVAVIAVTVAGWRGKVTIGRLRRLKLGRDGERVVGQFLERLRDGGGQVFHDIPGDGFNLDHVVVSTHGIYAIETKTLSKPWPRAIVTVEGDSLRVAGHAMDRNPIEQVSAAARWLERLLLESTGRPFAVRGVVVFPGWFVEQKSTRGPVWVLEPKALPEFIAQEPESVTSSDVALASFHLSRYIRAEVEKNS
jgi:hypothetical protein